MRPTKRSGITSQPPTIIGEHAGHNQHAEHSVATFRDKLWLSLALTLPLVLWSGEVQHGLATVPCGDNPSARASRSWRFRRCSSIASEAVLPGLQADGRQSSRHSTK